MHILLWVSIDDLEELDTLLGTGSSPREITKLALYLEKPRSEFVCVSLMYSTYVELINNPKCEIIYA